MARPVTTVSLDPVLRGVSRSIFLTLRAAPRAVRRQLGIGYLFCRAADTVADTRLVGREERLEKLRRLRGLFGDAGAGLHAGSPAGGEIERITSGIQDVQAIPEERQLLERLRECFEAYGRLSKPDRDLLARLVTTLTRGMEMDLERFPPEESGRTDCLETDEDLCLYTYYVAGCVGEFWTDLCAANLRPLAGWDLPRMRQLGVRFGKGLQMTNILRDVDRDLSIGRCYFPRPRLDAAGATPQGLRAGEGRDRLAPILAEYLDVTLSHYEAGWQYTLAIPRRVPRLRLACAWPLLIGLATLRLLARSRDPYAPGKVLKISRRELRSIIVRSSLRIFSNRALDRMYRAMEASARM